MISTESNRHRHRLVTQTPASAPPCVRSRLRRRPLGRTSLCGAPPRSSAVRSRRRRRRSPRPTPRARPVGRPLDRRGRRLALTDQCDKPPAGTCTRCTRRVGHTSFSSTDWWSVNDQSTDPTLTRRTGTLDGSPLHLFRSASAVAGRPRLTHQTSNILPNFLHTYLISITFII